KGDVTGLGKLAAHMKPGTWAELKTQNLNLQLLTDGSTSCMSFSDKAIWDPNTRQLFFSGSGHEKTDRFLKYSEATNSWTSLTNHPGGKEHSGYWHAYDNQAIDPAAGIYYRTHLRGRFASIFQYDIKKDQWSKLTDRPGNAEQRITGCGFEYFPEMHGLVVYYVGGELYLYDLKKAAWKELHPGPLGTLTYSEIARYNPAHKVVVF